MQLQGQGQAHQHACRSPTPRGAQQCELAFEAGLVLDGAVLLRAQGSLCRML